MLEVLKALKGFRDDCPVFVKENEVKFGSTEYSFVDLKTILDIINPLLDKHGLFVVQYLNHIDIQPALTTELIHIESGQSLISTAILTLAKQDPQAGGSAITYYRRYSLVTMLGLITDDIKDDDGIKATFNDKELEARKAPVVPLKPAPDKKKIASHEAISQIAFDRKKLEEEEQTIFDAWMKSEGLSRGKWDAKNKKWSEWNISYEDLAAITGKIAELIKE